MFLIGQSVEGVRQKLAKARRMLMEQNNKYYFVLSRKEITDINKELERIYEEENDIYNLEKLWIYFYQNKECNIMTLEELGISLSDNLRKILEIDNSGEIYFYEIKYEIRNIIYEYYSRLREKTCQKQKLERKKELAEEKLNSYKQAEEEYLNNEEIFNQNYIIKGTKLKPLEKNKEADNEISIFDLTIPKKAIIHLHLLGINTINELVSKGNNIQEMQDFLSSIPGLNKLNRDEIIMKLIEEGYFNKEGLSREKIPIKQILLTDVEELDLRTKTYNCLKRAGINKVEDLLDLYDEDSKWDKLLKIRNSGQRVVEEILRELETIGAINNGKPIQDLKAKEDMLMNELELSTPKNEWHSKKIVLADISELDLTIRTYNCLKRAGINKVEDILNLYDEDSRWENLLKTRNVGRRMAEEILSKLEMVGVTKRGKPIQDLKNEEDMDMNEHKKSATDNNGHGSDAGR